ncbi:o-spanin [Proteus phage Privateer]|uniref:O-spanin n=1 Tax=Proteus phage Privateer TaxID=2712958 RepID=A0A6G8R3N6_9CAUD|nr:o-spanin [Proteus phage Privateer]QIN94817.1 o-spanin [Proteus phage Privateer]
MLKTLIVTLSLLILSGCESTTPVLETRTLPVIPKDLLVHPDPPTTVTGKTNHEILSGIVSNNLKLMDSYYRLVQLQKVIIKLQKEKRLQ